MARTLTVNVLPVNDPPAGSDNPIAVTEDTAVRLYDGRLPDQQRPGKQRRSLAVRINTLPAAGQLVLNNTAITAGSFVSAADIAAHNFKFLPAANANGANYGQFQFQVQDNGGAANGGNDLAVDAEHDHDQRQLGQRRPDRQRRQPDPRRKARRRSSRWPTSR